MPETLVFDIETYRPSSDILRTRREDFDPKRNTIVTVGIFDGKQTSIYPTIQDLSKEDELVLFFLGKLQQAQNPILIGFNILHFDVPYMVHKAELFGRKFDPTMLKPLDLYWILPYWLRNTPTGKEFSKKNPSAGNLWKFENVVSLILKERANPISNRDIQRLWEAKRFQDIDRHLELDLVNTFSFFKSQPIQESLNHIQKQTLDKKHCQQSCPFQRPLSRTYNTAIGYCTLLREPTTKEIEMSPVDAICCSLPQRDISWVPWCSASQ